MLTGAIIVGAVALPKARWRTNVTMKTTRLPPRSPLAGARRLLGCKPSAAHQKHAGTAEDPFVIGMSQCNLGEPWRVQMNEDVKRAAAKHPNIKVVFKDAQNESLTQRAQVEELVDQGIDLLIISPKEAAPLTKPGRRASTRRASR